MCGAEWYTADNLADETRQELIEELIEVEVEVEVEVEDKLTSTSSRHELYSLPCDGECDPANEFAANSCTS